MGSSIPVGTFFLCIPPLSVFSLPLDESLQLWLQILIRGIVEHQTFISILEWYDCMVFTCRIAINLIRMIGQDDAFWQYGKVSQRKILLGKCLFVVTIPSSPIIASLAASALTRSFLSGTIEKISAKEQPLFAASLIRFFAVIVSP